MSDRDEVRKLAEEIAGIAHRQGISSFEIEHKITTLLAQREADLQAQLHRALGEGARLRQVAERAEREITERLDTEYEVTGDRANLALFRSAHTASPLSERAGAVLEATEAERSIERELEAEWRRKGVFGDVDEKAFERKVRPYRVRRQVAVDALRVELAKGGDDA